MASLDTLLGNVLNVKGMVVDGCRLVEDGDGVRRLRVQARPDARRALRCPQCGASCPGYDSAASPRVWRGLDWGGVIVEVEAVARRVECPEHGVVTAMVPWAYPGSRFTREFDLTVAWLAENLSKSAVAELMRIDWATVGSCVSRALADLEPERERRLDGLVNIGIDETSYRKGHRYVTVIVNHDTGEVVWVHDKHGKAVLEEFYRSLSEEQLASIRVVTGDGARWITDCVNEFTPGVERCVDPFHVVEWAMQALDEVRAEQWRETREKARRAEAEAGPAGRGRPKAGDAKRAAALKAREDAKTVKDSKYALGKAPENLTDAQRVRLDQIQARDPRLWRAYRLKESLRNLLKLTDVAEAERELDRWLWWASHSRIKAFHDLYLKIKRHKKHILNTIRLGLSNARVEATNNKIKLIIRKAYGFRNLDNMIDMIYLVCSNIRIPLPNRPKKCDGKM